MSYKKFSQLTTPEKLWVLKNLKNFKENQKIKFVRYCRGFYYITHFKFKKEQFKFL